MPWALGLGDSAVRLPLQRSFVRVEPGDWPIQQLSDAERQRYVGNYLSEGDTIRVWEAEGRLRITETPGLPRVCSPGKVASMNRLVSTMREKWITSPTTSSNTEVG